MSRGGHLPVKTRTAASAAPLLPPGGIRKCAEFNRFAIRPPRARRTARRRPDEQFRPTPAPRWDTDGAAAARRVKFRRMGRAVVPLPTNGSPHPFTPPGSSPRGSAPRCRARRSLQVPTRTRARPDTGAPWRRLACVPEAEVGGHRREVPGTRSSLRGGGDHVGDDQGTGGGDGAGGGGRGVRRPRHHLARPAARREERRELPDDLLVHRELHPRWNAGRRGRGGNDRLQRRAADAHAVLDGVGGEQRLAGSW